MSVSAMIAAMEDAGIPADKILATVKIMDEERLAKGRARTAKCRNNKGDRDVTNVTRVTPPPPDKKGSPQTPLKELTPTHVSANADTFDCDFNEWYSAYPRHQGRGQALKAYRAARKKVPAAELLRGARAAHQRFQAPYVPLPASWLNGERWDDEDSTGPPVVCRMVTIEEIQAEIAAERAKANGTQVPNVFTDRRNDVRREGRH